jgi:hypothetical protein
MCCQTNKKHVNIFDFGKKTISRIRVEIGKTEVEVGVEESHL